MDDPHAKTSTLVETKQRWARERRGLTGNAAPRGQRLPPGQRVVDGLPVLDLGTRPEIAAQDWRLTVAGAVAVPMTWTWAEFLEQPQAEVTVDVHCVTAWSSYDNRFAGVPFRHLMEVVRPKARAGFVMARSFDGYSTNLPIEALAEADALLAHSWNGAPLPREHGGPVRLVVPRLYFWKSAKWLRHLTFLTEDQGGYWEVRGYHRRGDPWTEERYE